MFSLSGVGPAAAFLAGIVSFLSPCVLPLVPGYISYIAGQSAVDPEAGGGWRTKPGTIWLSLLFVFGFSAVFIAFGASATALGQLLLEYRSETNLVGGVIVGLFGLMMTGILRLTWLHRDFRFHARVAGGHALGAFILGAAFAFGWTPCIGPVLGAILTLSASSPTASDGIRLLTLYSLGLGVPFLLTAAFMGTFVRGLETMRRIGRPLQVVAGSVMVAMGLAMITGKMSLLAIWFLQTFPILQSIG